jgi:hypothetical protein
MMSFDLAFGFEYDEDEISKSWVREVLIRCHKISTCHAKYGGIRSYIILGSLEVEEPFHLREILWPLKLFFSLSSLAPFALQFSVDQGVADAIENILCIG